MLLSEVWRNSDFCNSIIIPDYTLGSLYCREHYEGGGVCLMIKDNIDFIERKDIVKFSVEYIIEFCAIEIPKLNIIIIGLYRADRHMDIFHEQMNKLLRKLNSKDKNKHIVIGGDFNVNMKVKNKQSQDLTNIMHSFNLKQLIRKPTRVTKNTSTCIDLIFTNNTTLVEKSYVEDYGLCDHKAINLKLSSDLHHSKNHMLYKQSRIFTKNKINSFKNALKELDWENIIDTNNKIDYNYNSFLKIIKHHLNEHIPVQKTKIKNTTKKTWLTTGIKKSCIHKRSLGILVNETNSNVIRNFYKSYTKTLKRCVKISKKLMYIKQMKNSENKIKTMWGIINAKTGKKRHKKIKNMKLKIDNEEIECPIQIAEIFNNYFATIGENNNKNEVNVGLPVIDSPVNSLYLHPVTQQEVIKIIKQLKNKHSHGIDEIPPSLLKQCADELSQPLTYLINQSFRDGDFPNLLKISLIKPAHKKDDTSNPKNYRPIAILPSFSKVLEKAMCNRLYTFLEKYKILDDCQNGFRKTKSTTLAVYKYIQAALQYLNDKKNALGILLDMTKAYDKVSHKILLSKLYGSGVRGTAYNWFRSYLTNRKQIVQIQYYNSMTNEIEIVTTKERDMTCSIPQGSVLGCVLFLIYINDLPKILNKELSLPILFADDVSILIKCDKSSDPNSLISNTLEIVAHWLEKHNLEINIKKTKIIQFRPYSKAPQDINIIFKNTSIETVNTFNLLGLHIDTNINWKTHIDQIKTKLSKFTYALFEINLSTNTETALTAYYAYAYSWLKYGIMLWGNSVNAHELFLMQKKCIRIIAQIDNTQSCKPYFKKFNLLTLTSIYIHDLCLFVYRNLNSFTKFKDVHSINTRHKEKLCLPSSRIKMLSGSPYYMAIKIYNKLPQHIKNEQNLKTFNKQIKQYLIDKSFYTLYEYLNDK